MKKNQKELLLEQLRKIPIIQIACERSGVSRATYYRWRKEDKQFCKASDEALIEGEFLLNDMSESQLIALIKDKNLSAISLWLRNHHPKYADKLIVTNTNNDEALTPEQDQLLRKAFALLAPPSSDSSQQNAISKPVLSEPDHSRPESQTPVSTDES